MGVVCGYLWGSAGFSVLGGFGCGVLLLAGVFAARFASASSQSHHILGVNYAQICKLCAIKAAVLSKGIIRRQNNSSNCQGAGSLSCQLVKLLSRANVVRFETPYGKETSFKEVN